MEPEGHTITSAGILSGVDEFSFSWNEEGKGLAFVSARGWCTQLENKYWVPSFTVDFL